MSENAPIYSHNPYDATRFPLLVLDVQSQTCLPDNEGFRALHWHEEIQFVYILKGVVHFKVYEEDFDLETGDCLFLNRAVLHHITEKEDCHYHSYLIPPRMLSFFPGSAMEQNSVEAFLKNPALTHYCLRKSCPAHEKVLKNLSALDRLYFQQEKGSHMEYRLAVKIVELWLDFLPLLPEPTACGPDKGRERIRILISAIHTRYRESLSLQDLAQTAHVSRTECLRCFQKYLRCSPYQYLIRYRLHQSLPLLLNTELSVTEIAMQTGFCSASSYIRYFKETYQLTPRRYRSLKSSTP